MQLLIPFLNTVHRTHLNIFYPRYKCLYYTGDHLGCYVAIDSFFRVCESLASKKKKKKRKRKGSLLQDRTLLPCTPSGRAVFHGQNGPGEGERRKEAED